MDPFKESDEKLAMWSCAGCYTSQVVTLTHRPVDYPALCRCLLPSLPPSLRLLLPRQPVPTPPPLTTFSPSLALATGTTSSAILGLPPPRPRPASLLPHARLRRQGAPYPSLGEGLTPLQPPSPLAPLAHRQVEVPGARLPRLQARFERDYMTVEECRRAGVGECP